MFIRKPKQIDELVSQLLRNNGLETPLLQKRLIDAWDEVVANDYITACTQDKYIVNQTLFIKLSNPVLRHNLTMQRSRLIERLNAKVNAFIITDIRFK